jgi:hypothetical protein
MARKQTEKADQIRIEYVDIDTVAFWDKNPKLHDEQGIRDSITRYGFRDAAIFDSTLGALVAGNGRMRIAQAMKAEGLPAPRGIVVEGDRWLVPVQKGVDATTTSEAAAFAIDHNNLTVGPALTPIETARLWDPENYLVVLDELSHVDSLPITLDQMTIETLAENLGSKLIDDVKEGESTPPDDFKAYDETIATLYQCPQCAYRWSGKANNDATNQTPVQSSDAQGN